MRFAIHLKLLFRLEREAAADHKLGDTGIIIPKGMLITIPVYAMHRDPKYWPNPERFDPERFEPEVEKNRPEFCYLPFGAGPRKCLGKTFALIEIKFCLAYVVRHFKVNRCPETKLKSPHYGSPHRIVYARPNMSANSGAHVGNHLLAPPLQLHLLSPKQPLMSRISGQ
ncbi:Thromboxane-A synthase [Araneus ventricosus]|uniref:Thromboxane-A synthase n=1 Tax=Araneus ventricosus TaxID=182803 RepID=A0A4Y2EF95_ARAVE|nr:Thromboxane-A synthase [Araneus ventricosus]